MNGWPPPSEPSLPGDLSAAATTDPAAAGAPPIARASLRRNFAVMGFGQVVGWAIATVTAIIVPRYLGPQVQGRIHLVTSIWGLAGVLIVFGTGAFIQVVLARDQRQGLSLVAPVLAVRTAWFAVSAAVIAVIAVVLDVERTTLIFGVLLGIAVIAVVLDVERTTLIFGVLLGAATLLGRLRETFESVFVGLERMSVVARIGIVSGTLNLLATIVVLVAGLGAQGLLTMNAISAAVWLIVMGRVYLRLGGLDTDDLRTRSLGVLRGGAPFVLVTAAVALYREIDVIVIAKVAGDRDLGWYAAADRLSGSIMFPVTLTLGVLFPTLGRLWSTDRAAFERLLRRTFSLLVLIATPIGLGVAAVGPQLASILFGEDYSGTGVLLAIFGPVTIVTMATTLLGNVALVSERQAFLARLVLACAALTVPLDIVLVRWAADRYDNGAIGGMVAYAITEVLQFLVSLTLARYLVSRAMALWLARVFAAGGVMLAAIWPLRDEFILVPVGVGACVYALLVVVLRVLDQDQRQMIGDLGRQVRSGAARR